METERAHHLKTRPSLDLFIRYMRCYRASLFANSHPAICISYADMFLPFVTDFQRGNDRARQIWSFVILVRLRRLAPP